MPKANNDDPPSKLQADAARYQLLVRILPVQRHDLLGHLSVMRMATATARRQSQREAHDPAPTWALMEQQLKDAVGQVVGLRWWDRPAGLSEPPSVILQACLPVLQAAMALARHEMQMAPGGPDTTSRWPAPQSQLALLAVALHAADRVGPGWRWQLQWLPDGVHGRGAPAPRGDDPRRDRIPGTGDDAISRWMAQALAAEAGAGLQVGDEGWRLTWPTAKGAA